MIDALALHSLLVNLGFWKTGFVFHQRGKGKHRLVILLDDTYRQYISLVTGSMGVVLGFVYSDYNHVGSFHNASCLYGQGIAAIILSSRLTKKEVPTVTNSRLVCTKSKTHLSKTLCVLRLCVNVASIPCWTTKPLTLSTEMMKEMPGRLPMYSCSQSMNSPMASSISGLCALGILLVLVVWLMLHLFQFI